MRFRTRGARRTTEHWARRPAERHGALRGSSLDAGVRVENHLADTVIRAIFARDRPQQHEAAAIAVDLVLARGKRHVSPSSATFPNPEADEAQPLEWTALGSKDHFSVGELPL